MFDVGAAVVRIKTDLTDFQKGINDAKDQANGFASKLGGAASAINDFGKQAQGVALVVGGALAVGIKTSIDAFNESEQVMAQSRAVLKSTGGAAGVTMDQIIRLSRAIQDSTPISDEAALSAENMLLTFTNIGKDSFNETTRAVTDMATAMNGGATPSMEQMRTQAILVGKALQDPDAGLGALHRVGVNVDELKKKFTDSMSIQEKQKLILQELGSEFGGSAARQLETFGGRVDWVKNKLNDFQENVGNLLVTLTTFAATGKDTGLADAVGNIFPDDATADRVTGALTTIINGLRSLGAWLAANQNIVIPALTGIAIAIGALAIIGTISFLLASLLNPLTLVGIAIAGLYYIWSTNFYGFRDVTNEVFTEIMLFINTFLVPAFEVFIAWFTQRWTFIQLMIQGIWEIIKGVIMVAWAIIYGLLTVGIALLTGNWQGAWDAVIHTVQVAWAGIQSIFEGIIHFIQGWGGTMYNSLVKPFEDAWNRVSDLVNKIKNALDFTQRHSPSVIDIVRSGVGQVNDLLATLPVMSDVSPMQMQPLAGLSVAGGSSGGGVNEIHISLDGAIIADDYSATRISEMIGNTIIDKLKTNVKF